MSSDHVDDPKTREYLVDGRGDPVCELAKALDAFAIDEQDESIDFDVIDMREKALEDADVPS